MTIKSPSGCNKKITNQSPNYHNYFSFFIWTSSNCVTLTVVIAQNSILQWTVCDPSLFTTLKSHKLLETTHSRTIPSFTALFSSFVCMSMKHVLWSLSLLSDFDYLSRNDFPQNALPRLDATAFTLGPSVSEGLANGMTLMTPPSTIQQGVVSLESTYTSHKIMHVL